MDHSTTLMCSIPTRESLEEELRTTEDPYRYLETLRENYTSDLESCEPVFGLLTALGFKRSDIFRNIFSRLEHDILDEISGASKAGLLALVEETLGYLGHKSLESIPLKALSAYTQPPDHILERLNSVSPEVFETLPRHIKALVWESFPESFQEAVSVQIESYLNDNQAATYANEMFPDLQYPAPMKRRHKNEPLQLMLKVVTSSAKLYRSLVDIVRSEYLRTSNPNLCSLRFDILMQLHDFKATFITNTDPCHMLAWHLDACIKDITTMSASKQFDMKILRRKVEGIKKEFHQLLCAQYPGELKPVFILPHENRFDPANSVKRGVVQIRSNIKMEDIFNSIINILFRNGNSKPFRVPVIESYPQLKESYTNRIPKPMDLRTIRENINNGVYKNLDDLYADIYLIKENCFKFNGENDFISKQATNLVRVAEREHNKASSQFTNLMAQKREEEAKASKPVSALEAPNPEDESQSTEEKALAEEKRLYEEKLNKLQELAKEEESHRLSRSVSDGAMIFGSVFAINSMTALFWKVLGDEVLSQERLPREEANSLLHNVVELLEIGSCAHAIVTAATEFPQNCPIMPVIPQVVREAILPACACVLMESNAYGNAKKAEEPEPLDEELVQYSKTAPQPYIRHSLLYFFCQRVSESDWPIVKLLVPFVSDLGETATNDSAFMHSLITCFYLSSAHMKGTPHHSRSPKGAGKETQKDTGAEEVLIDCIQQIFVKCVERSYNETDEQDRVCRAHSYMARLLWLEHTQHLLGVENLLKYTRNAIMSLVGITDETATPNETESQLLKTKYYDDSFDRARRQYEKLFTKYPVFRSKCSIPMTDRGITPMPSPSPDGSPSITPYRSPPSGDAMEEDLEAPTTDVKVEEGDAEMIDEEEENLSEESSNKRIKIE